MCDEAVDAYLLALKPVADWLLTNKMLEKFNGALFSNDDKVFAAIDSNIVNFFNNDMGLHTIQLNSISLDDYNLDDYDPETIIHVYGLN